MFPHVYVSDGIFRKELQILSQLWQPSLQLTLSQGDLGPYLVSL